MRVRAEDGVILLAGEGGATGRCSRARSANARPGWILVAGSVTNKTGGVQGSVSPEATLVYRSLDESTALVRRGCHVLTVFLLTLGVPGSDTPATRQRQAQQAVCGPSARCPGNSAPDKLSSKAC